MSAGGGTGAGGEAWPVGGAVRLGLAALVVLVAGFGGWSVSATLSGAVVAPGQVEVERNRQAIQHPAGGIVAELLVREGARVEAGQVLVRLDPADLESELAVAEARLAELRAGRARLEAERDGADVLRFPPALVAQAAGEPAMAELLRGQETLFAARADTLAREVAQLRARITQIAAQGAALAAQAEALAAQIALVEAELALRQDLLDRGSGTREPVMRLRQELVQLGGSAGEIAARRAEAEERIIETELAILQLGTRRREEAVAELREVRAAEQEVAERAAHLALRIARLDLRAPVAGRIHGLTVFGPGAVLRPADPFAFLVPEGRPLVISARVPAVDIDAVFAGQGVSLRFAAFDRRDMPEVAGEVGQVSADAFLDEATGARFYRVEIVMAPDEAARLGDRVLVPGMPVEAYIRTTERTPLAYLLEPFAAYFARALREG